MPISYTYDSSKNVVFMQTSDEVTMAGLKEYFENVLADEKISNGFWEVVDTEGTKNAKLNYKDCIALLPLVKRFVSEKEYKGTLLFAPNKLVFFGAILMFGVLRSVLPIKLFVAENREDFQNLIKDNLH